MRRKATTTTYRQVKTSAGRMLLHRIRAERALGKPLPAGAVVHHADGSIADDAPLVICQDDAYHKLLHVRMRVKAAGGDPNTDAICGRCRAVKPRAAFSSRGAWSVKCTCRDCNTKRKSELVAIAKKRHIAKCRTTIELEFTQRSA